MCGRLKTLDDLNEIRIELKITADRIRDYPPHYNLPPTALLPVVTAADGGRTLEQMRWGLVPAWAKNDKQSYATFNARADTVATKPAFRSAWKAGRRCLIITDGFYEWRRSDKQPYFISLGNRQPLTFAGLWEEWRSPTGEILRSCTVITTDANSLIGNIHNRMPVILGPENWAPWLGEESCEAAALLLPFPSEHMTMWPVNKRVGNVKNNDAGLIDRVSLPA